jgi:guanylate kinase
MKKTKPNFILAIIGVAGAGKRSVVSVLRDQPKRFGFSVSYTTRAPRPGEETGVDYNYIDDKDFDIAIKKGDFLEWEPVHSDKYGTKKADFDKLLKSDLIPVIEIDVNGAEFLRKKYGKKVVSVFIAPPSLDHAVERLAGRGTETEEDKAIRISRYEMEMSYKDKADHVVINDNLEQARRELSNIVEIEAKKHGQRFHLKNVLFLSILLALLTISTVSAKYLLPKDTIGNFLKNIAGTLDLAPKEMVAIDDSTPDESSSFTIPTFPEPEKPAVEPEVQDKPVTPSKETKKKIAAEPPKYVAAPPSDIVEKTNKNSDGSTTTVVSTGGTLTAAEQTQATTKPTGTVASPEDFIFTDETNLHPGLGTILKDYITNSLLWKNEVSSFTSITVRNAGNTGWSGQYFGSYTVSADGKDITSATGSIVLNSYYYEGSSIFNDYMKLVLSHEYGHHYTLWHKWVDWDLSISDRFPDSYYAVRPLSKVGTATDYSLGWGNCEAEIMAEDYSYFYSGYSYHGMASTYGYPSLGTKTWLTKIGTAELLTVVPNVAPTLTITAPATSAVLSGKADFTVDAADDNQVAKVSFYINDTLVSEDLTAPYAAEIPTTTYENGTYTLKAVASDGTLSTEASVSVTFENAILDLVKPVISITAPATNPYTLTDSKLAVSVSATDNVAVSKIELYYNNELQGSWNLSSINLEMNFSGAGEYDLVFRAYDEAGNYSEQTLVINKT